MTFPRDFSKLTTNLHQITLKILLTNLHQIIDINREERGKRRGKERGAYVGEVCLRRWRLPHARWRRVPHVWATRATWATRAARPTPQPPLLLVASTARPWARSPEARSWARRAAPTGCFGRRPPPAAHRPRPRPSDACWLLPPPPATTWSEDLEKR